jgi:hypothetical protein
MKRTLQPLADDFLIHFGLLELVSQQERTAATREMFLAYLYSGIREPELKIMDVFVCRSRKKIARPTGGNHYIEDGMGSRLYPSRAHPHRWDGHSRCDMRVCSHSPVSFPAVSTMLRPRMQPS